jgi:hypothetical protein
MVTLANEIRKSRKQRHCWECGRTVQVGERYRYVFGDGDGSWDMGSWSCCEQCDALFAALWSLPGIRQDFSEGFEIRDGGQDIVRETPSLPLRRALAWQKRNWVRADGTPLPIDTVRGILGTTKEQVA